MFAKWHRRPKEEEPLVPHGLVWQAMEEASPAEEQEALASQLQIVPRPVESPAGESSVRVSPSQADLASHKPPFWHKAAKPELVKPLGDGDGPTISPQASIPVVANAEIETPKQSLFFHRLDLITHQAHRANIARSGFAAATRKFLRRWDARVFVINFRKVFDATIRQGSALLVEARVKIQDQRPWEGLKRHVGWIATLVVAVAQEVHATAQRGYAKVKVNARTYLSTKHAAVQHDTAPAGPPVETLAPRPIAGQSLKPIILAGFSLRVAVALKRFLPGTERLQAIRRDSQLRTSFAMAGLSALLLLGFVLSVRHYATESLPSHVLHGNSLTERAPAEAAVVASQKLSAPVESSHATKQTAVVSPKPSSLPRVAKPRPKPRHTEDDDYVARDTFVSYENRRSTHR